MQNELLNQLFELQEVIANPQKLSVIDRSHLISSVAETLEANLTGRTKTTILSRLNDIINDLDTPKGRSEVQKRIDEIKILITDVLMNIQGKTIQQPSKAGTKTKAASSKNGSEDKVGEDRKGTTPTPRAAPGSRSGEDGKGGES